MTPLRQLKIAIWFYFVLLMSEGALRKWFLPQFSDVLFLVRDPLVIIIYLLAWRGGWLRLRPSLVFLWIMAVLALAFALTSDAPWAVVLFGMRTNFLHVPLIFVLGEALNRDDARRFGTACLWLTPLVTLLMVMQFNSPRDAFINLGTGAQESGQIIGALNRVRPPGPFSFVSGLVMFFNLVAAFVLARWMHPGGSRLLLLLGTLCCAIAVPVSISRSLLFTLLVVGAFGLLAALREARRLPRFFAPMIATVIMLLVTADSTYMQAFQTRWDEALVVGRGGFGRNVVGRVLDDFTQPFQHAIEAPLTGHGIGLGTVAGARLTTGRNQFLLAEIEWSRIVLELGPVLGFAFIGWRVWLALSLLRRSWRHFREKGDPLAWLLAGAAFLPIVNAQWGPSTHLGFAVFTAGLSLAALNSPPEDDPDEADATEDALPSTRINP
jgi:hypothetical protein